MHKDLCNEHNQEVLKIKETEQKLDQDQETNVASSSLLIQSTETLPPHSSASVIDEIKDNTHYLTFRIPKGETGKQGIQGPQGIQGEQGITGPTGAQGIQGERGADGTSVSILGTYTSIKDLQIEHPRGNINDAYMIEHELYVWSQNNNMWQNVGVIKGPTGPQGIQGLQGERGIQGPQGIQGERGATGPQGLPSIGAILPFASGYAPILLTNKNGSSVNAVPIAFGFGGYEGNLIIQSDESICMQDLKYQQFAFTIPVDCKIHNIYVSFTNYTTLVIPDNVQLYPIIQLYRAHPTSNQFMPIERTLIQPTQSYAGTVRPNTVLVGSACDVEVSVFAGERVAIIARLITQGTQDLAISSRIYFTGGINFQ